MNSWETHAAKFLGFSLTDQQLKRFELYEETLIEWNSRFNLTAIREPEAIRIKHFLDSLSCAAATGDLNGKSLIDVGTGAGFPGIALKIAFPAMGLTLVDSVGKKIKFCQHVCETLGFTDFQTVHGRAEDLGQDKEFREQFDVAAARAVTGLPALAELLLPLVKTGGMMVAQKGDTAGEEAAAAMHSLAILGGSQPEIHAVEIPEIEEKRFIITVQKVKKTPATYPRRPDQIRKVPLS